MNEYIFWLFVLLAFTGITVFAVKLAVAVTRVREQYYYKRKLERFKRSFPTIRVVDTGREQKKSGGADDIPKFGDF